MSKITLFFKTTLPVSEVLTVFTSATGDVTGEHLIPKWFAGEQTCRERMGDIVVEKSVFVLMTIARGTVSQKLQTASALTLCWMAHGVTGTARWICRRSTSCVRRTVW